MTTQTSQQDRHFRILVGADLAAAGAYALDQAVRLFERIPGAELHVVHVVDDSTSEARTRLATAELRAHVAERCAATTGVAENVVGIHVRAGVAADAVVELASVLNADLIVLGADRAARRRRLGSVAAAVRRSTSRPVLVSAPSEAHEPVIEPLCTDCILEREATGGGSLWCDRHAQHHPRAHVMTYRREFPFAGDDPLAGA